MSKIDKVPWNKIKKTKTCWIWTACVLQSGYGQGYERGKRKYAHRLVYEVLVGKIPKGLQIDHLCRNRTCVNPDHLEPVTCRENLFRSEDNSATKNSRKTHCLRGHNYDSKNTYIQTRKGYKMRHCRKCQKEFNKKYYYKTKNLSAPSQ